MIYRLEIENFYCFREKQILDLTVPLTVPDNPQRFAPIFEGSDLRVPKVVSIFGANGSGKSTVLKALATLIWFVKSNFQDSPSVMLRERFNDEESKKRPIRLAMEFGGIMDLTYDAAAKAAEGHAVPQGIYRYELEFGLKDGFVSFVKRERLRRKRFGKGKWSRVFDRPFGGIPKGSNAFSLSGYAKIIKKIPKDASLLATLAQFEHEPSKLLVEAATSVYSNILFVKTNLDDASVVRHLAANPSVVKDLNKQLQRIDVGIKNVEIVSLANGPVLAFQHEGLTDRMTWNLESHGTQSFIRIFPFLFSSLERGGVAIIDELDISIHPLILPEIIRWYYDAGRNPNNAQLWMTCHSASLLDDLDKEEIVFCEKNRQGQSEVYSLKDIGQRPARRGDNFYKKYLSGAYGAVPHIG